MDNTTATVVETNDVVVPVVVAEAVAAAPEDKAPVISKTVVDYLTTRDIAIVTLAYLEALKKSEYVSAKDIFPRVKDQLQNPDMKDTNFFCSVSQNRAAGRMPGFLSRKGPNGGLTKEPGHVFDVAALEAVVAAPETETAGTPTGRGKGPRKPKDPNAVVVVRSPKKVDGDIAARLAALEAQVASGEPAPIQIVSGQGEIDSLKEEVARLEGLLKEANTATDKAIEEGTEEVFTEIGREAELTKQVAELKEGLAKANAEVDEAKKKLRELKWGTGLTPSKGEDVIRRSKSTCFVWLNGERYEVPATSETITDLMLLLGGASGEGGTFFGEKKWDVDQEALKKFIVGMGGGVKPI